MKPQKRLYVEEIKIMPPGPFSGDAVDFENATGWHPRYRRRVEIYAVYDGGCIFVCDFTIFPLVVLMK